MKKLRITVDGKVFDVSVELLDQVSSTTAALDVAAGASVKAGDQILTLEAMKMNTIIYAPASGTLTAFCVNPGDTVQEGQALAKIG